MGELWGNFFEKTVPPCPFKKLSKYLVKKGHSFNPDCAIGIKGLD
jgi:hypothetical protein